LLRPCLRRTSRARRSSPQAAPRPAGRPEHDPPRLNRLRSYLGGRSGSTSVPGGTVGSRNEPDGRHDRTRRAGVLRAVAASTASSVAPGTLFGALRAWRATPPAQPVQPGRIMLQAQFPDERSGTTRPGDAGAHPRRPAISTARGMGWLGRGHRRMGRGCVGRAAPATAWTGQAFGVHAPMAWSSLLPLGCPGR
jgi:hypothetical protein